MNILSPSKSSCGILMPLKSHPCLSTSMSEMTSNLLSTLKAYQSLIFPYKRDQNHVTSWQPITRCSCCTTIGSAHLWHTYFDCVFPFPVFRRGPLASVRGRRRTKIPVPVCVCKRTCSFWTCCSSDLPNARRRVVLQFVSLETVCSGVLVFQPIGFYGLHL